VGGWGFLSKTERIELRVKEKDKELCRFLRLNYSHVWDLGMEHLYKNMHKYIEKMYVQKADLEANVRTVVYKADDRNGRLNDLVDKYVKERDIEHPSRLDLNWISSRIEKIDGLTVEGFLSYCKFKKDGK